MTNLVEVNDGAIEIRNLKKSILLIGYSKTGSVVHLFLDKGIYLPAYLNQLDELMTSNKEDSINVEEVVSEVFYFDPDIRLVSFGSSLCVITLYGYNTQCSFTLDPEHLQVFKEVILKAWNDNTGDNE